MSKSQDTKKAAKKKPQKTAKEKKLDQKGKEEKQIARQQLIYQSRGIGRR